MLDVLIMDDDEFFLDIFMSLVSHMGFNSFRCRYTEALPELLERKEFPILLINLHDNYQNHGDWIPTLNHIDHEKTKTIILSSYYDSQFEEQPFFQYLHAYLIKPKGLLHLKPIFHDLACSLGTIKENKIKFKENSLTTRFGNVRTLY